jgi:hypothetical protein
MKFHIAWNIRRSFYTDLLCGLVVEFLATDPEVRFQFPEIEDFLRSCGSGTGSAQPREYN